MIIGGVSCDVVVTGLEARINTVRHLIGGDLRVQGALFLTKQRKAPVKRYNSIMVGSPKSVVQELIDGHCSAPQHPRMVALTRELDAMFLPFEKLTAA